MNLHDLTIVIQGPLNTISLGRVEYYTTMGRVIVSCWSDGDFSLLDGLDNIDVVYRDIVKDIGYPQATYDYHLRAMELVLPRIQTPYVMRTRSDECWSNLALLIERFETDTSKTIFGNIFFRPWSVCPFHIGDHVFIGTTDTIYGTYNRLINEANRYVFEYCAEVSFTKAMLDHLDLKHTRKHFEQTVDIIDINILAPFVAQYQTIRLTFRDSFEYKDTIRSMEEL